MKSVFSRWVLGPTDAEPWRNKTGIKKILKNVMLVNLFSNVLYRVYPNKDDDHEPTEFIQFSFQQFLSIFSIVWQNTKFNLQIVMVLSGNY